MPRVRANCVYVCIKCYYKSNYNRINWLPIWAGGLLHLSRAFSFRNHQLKKECVFLYYLCCHSNRNKYSISRWASASIFRRAKTSKSQRFEHVFDVVRLDFIQADASCIYSIRQIFRLQFTSILLSYHRLSGSLLAATYLSLSLSTHLRSSESLSDTLRARITHQTRRRARLLPPYHFIYLNWKYKTLNWAADQIDRLFSTEWFLQSFHFAQFQFRFAPRCGEMFVVLLSEYFDFTPDDGIITHNTPAYYNCKEWWREWEPFRGEQWAGSKAAVFTTIEGTQI